MSEVTALHKGLRILKLLPGHEISGISNRDLAAASGLSASAVTRIMAALIDEGLACKLDNGLFAPTVRLGQLTMRTLTNLDATHGRVAEMRQRMTITA